MIKLTNERRKTLKIFWINAGTIFLGAMVVGSWLSEKGFYLITFLAGCILYSVCVLNALALDQKERKKGD